MLLCQRHDLVNGAARLEAPTCTDDFTNSAMALPFAGLVRVKVPRCSIEGAPRTAERRSRFDPRKASTALLDPYSCGSRVGLTRDCMYPSLYVMTPSHDEDAVWQALAHATRRQILDVLVDGPHATGEVVAALALDRHVVMSHLAVLRRADLVTTQRQGRVRMNYLNPVPLQQMHHRWITPVSGPWAAALIAVRDEAERPAFPAPADQNTAEETRHSG